MSVRVWARNVDAPGQRVCGEAHVGGLRSGEVGRGQEGWEVGINFYTSDDLVDLLRAHPRLRTGGTGGGEHIIELAIAAHGSIDSRQPSTFGAFAINGTGVGSEWLRDGNLRSAHSRFVDYLADRLERNAVVYLMGCQVAATETGRHLLMRLSEAWPGRRVVGFTGEGQSLPEWFGDAPHAQHTERSFGEGGGFWRGQGGGLLSYACDLPGMLFEDTAPGPTMPGTRLQWGTWGLRIAVSARNGQIVRR